MNNDKPKSFCGIFGIFGNKNASLRTYYGLHSLQHRGQEAAGIVSSNQNGEKHFHIERNNGLVSDVFHDLPNLIKTLPGNAAIGHNRYSTTGSSKSKKNIQPFVVNYRLGNIAIAHNGNLTNAKEIREELVKDGAIFQSSSDTEVILHLIARSKLDNQIDQIKEALQKVKGAFCLVILTDDKLIAARDENGFRPFCLGKLGDSFIATSETCALDINAAKYVRDIKPGEIVVIDKESIETGVVKSQWITEKPKEKNHCVFEYIYFSRPDSHIFGAPVDKMRRKLGKILALNHPVKDADGEKVLVMSVPDSSNTAALGYMRQLAKMGIPAKYDIGLIRSHYIGRTFILPGQESREMGVRVKFNTVKGVIAGNTIVVIDDSIVRGTTSKLLVKLLKEANPKAIHLRISSPPILYPCYYGMDFPSKAELIANKCEQNIEKIRKELDVESLEYLTVDEMLEAMTDHSKEDFCTSCFSGKYPVPINDKFNKEEYDK